MSSTTWTTTAVASEARAWKATRGGSRFRDTHDPGVFYGAESVRTACMALGCWRWRFLMDAPALQALAPLPFTAFASRRDSLRRDPNPANKPGGCRSRGTARPVEARRRAIQLDAARLIPLA